MDLDKLILLAVQSLSSPLLDKFFITMSRLGEVYLYLPLIAVIYWCSSRKSGRRLALALFFSAIVNAGLKQIFIRPRPIGGQGIRSIYTESAGGFSFPSGHTQQSAAFWRTFVLLYSRRIWDAVGIVVVLLVGASRVYLGVHWPSDVLGGLAFGLLVAGGLGFLEEKISPIWLNRAALLIALAASVASFFNPVAINQLVCGFFTGALLGLTPESKNQRENRPTLVRSVCKIMLGFGGLWLVWTFFPWGALLGYVRAMAAGFWVTAGAPWVFCRLKFE